MKAQQKQIGKQAFEMEAVQVRISVHKYERSDLMTAVDALMERCAEEDCEVFEVLGEMTDAVSNLVELSDELAQLRNAVSGIYYSFSEDGGDVCDASYLLRDHADALQDLNAELRDTARSLIEHIEAVIDIKR